MYELKGNKISAFKEEVIVCSGSRMGENIAIESYLRAVLTRHAIIRSEDIEYRDNRIFELGWSSKSSRLSIWSGSEIHNF